MRGALLLGGTQMNLPGRRGSVAEFDHLVPCEAGYGKGHATTVLGEGEVGTLGGEGDPARRFVEPDRDLDVVEGEEFFDDLGGFGRAPDGDVGAEGDGGEEQMGDVAVCLRLVEEVKARDGGEIGFDGEALREEVPEGGGCGRSRRCCSSGWRRGWWILGRRGCAGGNRSVPRCG
jgi:hypothetical protein